MMGYSTISEAAKEAGYSSDKLISFGANEIISIGLVVGEGLTILQLIEKGTGEIIEEKAGGFPGHTVKVSSKCLKQAEAGVKNAEIILVYYLGKDEQPIEIIKIMDLDTGKPLLVKDARLIVFDEDLAILKGLGKLDALKGKKPKRLKPIERETSESLLLIYEITKSQEVKYLHQLPAEAAWGLIVSKKFQTDLIAEYPTMKPRVDLVLNGGEALDKRTFTQKYLKRFE